LVIVLGAQALVLLSR
jgi:hypothetical protein